MSDLKQDLIKLGSEEPNLRPNIRSILDRIAQEEEDEDEEDEDSMIDEDRMLEGDEEEVVEEVISFAKDRLQKELKQDLNTDNRGDRNFTSFDYEQYVRIFPMKLPHFVLLVTMREGGDAPVIQAFLPEGSIGNEDEIYLAGTEERVRIHQTRTIRSLAEAIAEDLISIRERGGV